MNIPVGPYLKDEIYRPRLVLYLDILGFSHAVENSASNPEQAKRIVQLLENLVAENTTSKEANETGWLLDFGYRGVRRISMSDSILVSIDATFDRVDLLKQAIFSQGFQFDPFGDMNYYPAYVKHLALSSILRACTKIQVGLLENGFLSRGALTVGSLRQHRGTIVGPAFSKAVRLEKHTKLPVIVLSNEVVKEYLYTWKLLLQGREYTKTKLKADPRRLDVAATDVWAVANESEKWVSEVQSCMDCIEINRSRRLFNFDGLYIFNFIRLANAEGYFANKADVAKLVERERATLAQGLLGSLLRRERKKNYTRWSWACRQLGT